MKPLVIISFITFAAISLVFATLNKTEPETTQYIIQGASPQTILDNLHEIGGEILHTHSVISAVSANLTAKQQEKLLIINPMLRLFKDQRINVSLKELTSKIQPRDGITELRNTTVVKSKLKLSIKNKSAEWTLQRAKNNALVGIQLIWPEGNNGIQEIKIGEQKISPNFSKDNLLMFPHEIDVDERKNVELAVSFNELNTLDQNQYQLTLLYADGTRVKPTPQTYELQSNDTFFPTITRANEVHNSGITGYGVTVAIIDTGIKKMNGFKDVTHGERRVIDTVSFVGKANQKGQLSDIDENGHGTHLASIIADATQTENNNGTISYNGIAPDVNLLIVRAFDEEGQSNYADLIKSVEYVIENKNIYNVKVLNLSFSAVPSSHYWDDPLNQVIMRAWEAGITVVAAAGNNGPDAMTVGVPGNTPYVITVGAISDNYTPFDPSDDFVTEFSSAGPTYEGFVKPDLVAPGGRVKGLIDKNTHIRKQYSLFDDAKVKKDEYFELSGTSQATAIVSGIAALMLQANPDLTPDDIKCRLLSTANVALNENDGLAFSIFQQGAGLVDAMSAIESTARSCGNQGLDIYKDLAHEERFIGPARRYANNGAFYLDGVEGFEWSGAYVDSQIWGSTRFVTDSQIWGSTKVASTDSQIWGSTKAPSTDSQIWGSTKAPSTDSQIWGSTKVSSTDSQIWGSTKAPSTDSQIWGSTKAPSTDSQIWGSTKAPSTDSQIWGSTKAPSTDSQIWGSTKAPSTDSQIWGSTKAPNTDSQIWGSTKAPSTDSQIWGSTKAPSTDSQIWGSTKAPSTDSQIWGSTKAPSTDSQIWGSTKAPSTDSQIWGSTKASSTDSQIWGSTKALSTDSQIWGSTRYFNDSQIWGSTRFGTDSQIWGSTGAMSTDSQIWGSTKVGSTDSQIWGSTSSPSDTEDSRPFLIKQSWVDHE